MDDCFNRIKSYETAGDLCLDIHGDAPEFENYRREIDLTDGFAYVTYKLGGVNYRRELIASYPDNVIAFRMTADKPGSISFKSHFEREQDNFVKACGRKYNHIDRRDTVRRTISLRLNSDSMRTADRSAFHLRVQQ